MFDDSVKSPSTNLYDMLNVNIKPKLHHGISISNDIIKFFLFYQKNTNVFENKANLRDLVAATGLVFLLKIVNHQFFSTVTLKFDEWPRKTIGHLSYSTLSFLHPFKAICEF